MAKKDSTAPKKKRGAEFKPEPEQGELFVANIPTWQPKDDLASMEIPLFSLAKQKDTTPREYRRGNKVLRILPSTAGAATVFDKDLLIYVSSQVVEALNQKRAVSRTIKIDTIDFLLGTERGDGGASFDRIIGMLRRLRGTTIETNIPTGKDKITQTKGFSFIDTYDVLSGKKRTRVIKNKKTGKEESVEVESVYSFTVTINEWLYNGLLNFEVLTADRGYFKLSKPFERRLYEIARKHCGDKPMWKENIDGLAEKIGTARERFKIRDEIRDVIAQDSLPGYHIALDPNTAPDDVIVYTRDKAMLAREIIRADCYTWFQSLQRHENRAEWRTKKPKIKKAPAPKLIAVSK